MFRILFALACINLNACYDWCCGSKTMDHIEANCQIDDIEALKESLKESLNTAVTEKGSGSWNATLSNEDIIRVTPSQVNCTLKQGITETDYIRFDVKMENGVKTIHWLELIGELDQTEAQKLEEMPENCDYIEGPISTGLLNESLTKFLLGAKKIKGKALLNKGARKIYGRMLQGNHVFVWQGVDGKYRGRYILGSMFRDIQDLRESWKCDINAPDSLKDILKTKTTLTEKPDGSWYADLDVNAEKYFIFVNSAGECFCNLRENKDIHGIKFIILPNSEKKTIRWTSLTQ